MAEAQTPKRYARDFAEGECAFDHIDESSGLRARVLRGFASFCAYVGVQTEHPLAGLEDFEFDCHWGITWSNWGDDQHLPAGWYWWGWDYAHASDKMHFANLPPEVQAKLDAIWANAPRGLGHGKDWTVEEVTQDALDVLVTLREQLAHSAALAALAMPMAQRPG
jgi:hypothetical protein